MANTSPRRFIIAAPPSMEAAIGEALREAFGRPDLRSTNFFEKLLTRLNQLR